MYRPKLNLLKSVALPVPAEIIASASLVGRLQTSNLGKGGD